LTPLSAPEPAAWVARSCRQIEEIRGSLAPADKDELVRSLRREDTPMRFYRKLEDVPGYTTAGLPRSLAPPAGAVVALRKVVDLTRVQTADDQARLERGRPIRVTTPKGLGRFALHIALNDPDEIDMPCWVQLRLRVTAGRIGFAAWDLKRGILGYTSTALLKGPEPVDVVMAMPNLRGASYITITNRNDDGASRVEVYDAAVLVSQADFEKNQARLSKLR
jgi:hypothetical protein